MITDKHKKYYFLSVFVFELARTLPHAVLTLFFFDRGIRVEHIAMIQIFYMAAIIIFEFPSGLLSDLFDRKVVYLVSVFFSIIAYALIFFSTTLIMLGISWFLYGMSSAFNTGTLDVSFTRVYKGDGAKLKTFLSMGNIILSISAVIGGFIGSILFRNISHYIFVISCGLYVLSALVTMLFIPSDRSRIKQGKSYKEYIKSMVGNITKMYSSGVLIKLVILMSAVQFFFQPFYQYWQALFIQNGISPATFGVMYVVFRLSFAIAAWLFKKIQHSNRNTYIILFIVIVLTILSNLDIHEWYLIVATPAMIICVYIYLLNLDNCLRENVDVSVLGTVESINNTATRMVSIVVLLCSSLLVSIFDVTVMFTVLIVVFVLVSGVINLLVGKQSNSCKL